MDNFLYGSIGGLIGTILSHPVDTIKTRLQTKTSINVKHAIKMGHLFNGLKAPLIGIPFEKSIVFGFYNLAKENNINNFWSGILGGLMSTIIVTPVEYFKINLQNKHNITILNIKEMYKGLIPTICRETPGFGIYFSVYNYLNYNKHLYKLDCINNQILYHYIQKLIYLIFLFFFRICQMFFLIQVPFYYQYLINNNIWSLFY
jgi:hypothetical protein